MGRRYNGTIRCSSTTTFWECGGIGGIAVYFYLGADGFSRMYVDLKQFPFSLSTGADYEHGTKKISPIYWHCLKSGDVKSLIVLCFNSAAEYLMDTL
jgi:hypothetical protein